MISWLTGSSSQLGVLPSPPSSIAGVLSQLSGSKADLVADNTKTCETKERKRLFSL